MLIASQTFDFEIDNTIGNFDVCVVITGRLEKGGESEPDDERKRYKIVSVHQWNEKNESVRIEKPYPIELMIDIVRLAENRELNYEEETWQWEIHHTP